MGNTADIEYRGHMARIQRQLVALLPRYCLSDKLMKQVLISLECCATSHRQSIVTKAFDGENTSE